MYMAVLKDSEPKKSRSVVTFFNEYHAAEELVTYNGEN